jgi:MFS family permease
MTHMSILACSAMFTQPPVGVRVLSSTLPRSMTNPTVSGAAGSRSYPRYVLFVLIVVYVFNFLDRQIVAILAERIKADLMVTDAQLGFLYGTVFAVFFAVFGIPLGRLADIWDRRRLIAWGLFAWSLMTALSGLAKTFAQLALARVGVGVGEASAAPAAYSILSDTFPREKRATVLALYSSGIYIGSGLGLGIGGFIVDRWDAAFRLAPPPYGLRGWQVAFLAVGLPGLLLALWVRSLREPVRGAADGLPAPPPTPRPFRAFFQELMAVLPPFTFVGLALGGAPIRDIGTNAIGLGIFAGTAFLLTRLLGNPIQWIALGTGLYAAFSWAQALRRRNRADFELLFLNPALSLAEIGFALLAFTSYGTGFWITPFFVRAHGLSLASAGAILGANAALGGWLGVTFGGVLADALHRRSRAGRIWVGLLTAVLPVPFLLVLLFTPSKTLAFALSFPVILAAAMFVGPALSTVQDLVPPRLRGAASATFLLYNTFLGLSLGPYTIGRLSVATGSLAKAMALGLSVNAVAALLLLLAARQITRPAVPG